jgi:glycosyltransferase involved in cell wall biosynthesis
VEDRAVHLVALVETADHVCCRYRLAAFCGHLERAGHRLDIRPLPGSWWRRLWLFRSLRGADVVLQRRLLPGWQLGFLRRNVRTLLFDFDDAVFLRDSYSPKGLHDRRRMDRFSATVQHCDTVVAGNGFLAEQAVRSGARRVEIVPTCVDPDVYPLAIHVAGKVVQLVWVGSASTLLGMTAVAPLLEEIGRAVPGARLKLICDRFLALKHLPVIECPWTATGEAAEIAAADIGVSHIPDDQWSRGKCGLKVLQYMAAGLPVVANPVGVHREMIRDGETGFLVETPREWIGAIRRLADDAELRRRMGQAGRALLESRYSVAAGAAQWRALLDQLQRSGLEKGPVPISRPEEAA